MGKDMWIDEYYALDRSGDAIMELVMERNRLLNAGGDALRVSAKVRQAQNNYNYDLSALQRDIKKNELSPKESERRTNLLNEANIRKIQINKAIEETGGGASSFGGGVSNRGYEPEESDQTQGYSDRELLSQHQQTIVEQDKGLLRISDIVKRQKEIGITIGDEIDGQNELIEDITFKTDMTANRINRQTRAINTVSSNDSGVCGTVQVEKIPSCHVENIPHTTPDYEDNIAMYTPHTTLDYDDNNAVYTPHNTKVYDCTFDGCVATFSKPALLTYHIDKSHLRLKWFTCIYNGCDKSFYFPAHMKRHLRTHRPKSFYCELCYQYFSRKDNLKVHQRKCRLVLMCSVCGGMFLTANDIQKHRQTHCVYLKCIYKDCYEHLAPEDIRDHLMLHSDTLKCPMCVLMYCNRDNLELHMVKDHKVKYVSADYHVDIDFDSWFDMSFGDPASKDFIENVTAELGEFETENDITDLDQAMAESSNQKAASQNNLLRSIPHTDIIHETATPKDTWKIDNAAENALLYYCSEPNCKYSTSLPRWLKRHSLKHRNAESLICKICSKVLADKWGLKLHMGKHDLNKSFRCTYCGKKYTSQSRLTEHCQSYHPQSQVWPCDECNLKFTTQNRLMMHYKRHLTGETTKNPPKNS